MMKHRPDIQTKRERLNLYRGMYFSDLVKDLKYSQSRGFFGDMAEISRELEKRRRNR
jgi:hypothetical protein